jgi:hypothetical protein
MQQKRMQRQSENQSENQSEKIKRDFANLGVGKFLSYFKTPFLTHTPILLCNYSTRKPIRIVKPLIVREQSWMSELQILA